MADHVAFHMMNICTHSFPILVLRLWAARKNDPAIVFTNSLFPRTRKTVSHSSEPFGDCKICVCVCMLVCFAGRFLADCFCTHQTWQWPTTESCFIGYKYHTAMWSIALAAAGELLRHRPHTRRGRVRITPTTDLVWPLQKNDTFLHKHMVWMIKWEYLPWKPCICCCRASFKPGEICCTWHCFSPRVPHALAVAYR